MEDGWEDFSDEYGDDYSGNYSFDMDDYQAMESDWDSRSYSRPTSGSAARRKFNKVAPNFGLISLDRRLMIKRQY